METTLYERVGGKDWFVSLVDRFYDGVEQDPVLRPLYQADLGPARRHLSDFLIQYWGGPGDYSAVRGHPRLRMRHAPFAIGQAERLAWYRHMAAAVEAAATNGTAADGAAAEGDALSDDDKADLLRYFAGTALHLVNRPE